LTASLDISSGRGARAGPHRDANSGLGQIHSASSDELAFSIRASIAGSGDDREIDRLAGADAFDHVVGGGPERRQLRVRSISRKPGRVRFKPP
jgi:hypothetical protein